MTRFVFWGSLRKWLSPRKRFFGEHCFVHSSQSLPRFFGVNGCCFRKGSVEGSPNYSLHLSPKSRELLTCLSHTNPVHRKRPTMSLLLRYSVGLFPGKNNDCLLSCQGSWLFSRAWAPVSSRIWGRCLMERISALIWQAIGNGTCRSDG